MRYGKMKRKILTVGGSIGACVLLVLMTFPAIVNAQTVKTSEIKTNILQQIKEKIQNNDWKPGDILNIQHLKDVMKDGGWFPGYFILTTIFGIIALIILLITAGHPS